MKTADIQSFAEYLESIVDKPLLTKIDREPLIEQLNIRRNGRLCKNRKVLSTWLESSGLPYRLIEYRTSSTVEGKAKSYRAWRIVGAK